MEEINIRENGRIFRNMDAVNNYGKMDDNTKVISIMIRNMDMVYIQLLMDIDILENGKMDSNMDKEPFILEIKYIRKENGVMENI